MHSDAVEPNHREDPLPSPAPDHRGPTAGWAQAVARGVLRIGARYDTPALHEVRVTDDLVLHVRYTVGGEALAVRNAHLTSIPRRAGRRRTPRGWPRASSTTCTATRARMPGGTTEGTGGGATSRRGAGRPPCAAGAC